MTLDPDACYRALSARDARFDGLFFTGVASTGIYCRPVCPARTPGRARCRFFGSALEAEVAGFRACLRCRPELAPGGGASTSTSTSTRTSTGTSGEVAATEATRDLAGRALRLVEEGFLDERRVTDLARALGVTDRHLRRAVLGALGATPARLALSRRLAHARRLLRDTRLPLTAIAFESGFRSLRRFHAVFQERMGGTPKALRGAGAGARSESRNLLLRLDFRPPFDWPRLIAFLAARAVPGVEEVAGPAYARVVSLRGRTGVVRVRKDPRRDALICEASLSLEGALGRLVPRLRALFDLDARPDAIAAALGPDPLLGPLVRARPGLRLPGALDAFETGARVILGQQVSVAAATTLAGRLVRATGRPLLATETSPAAPTLTHAFPTPQGLAAASRDQVAALGLPGARADALLAFARACAEGPLDAMIGQGLWSPGDREAARLALAALPGIGPWTAEVLAMRALRDPDAFPAGDLGVRKALGLAPAAAARRAEAWRPYRSYAVMHLWTQLAESPKE